MGPAYFLTSLAAAAAVLLSAASAQSCRELEGITRPQMASGYESRLVMDTLEGPRHIVFDTEGALLIAEGGGNGIRHVTFTDNGGVDVCVNEEKQLIDDERLNHGIAISGSGRSLYLSSGTEVFEYPYDPVEAAVGSPRTIIEIPTQGGSHHTRTLFIPRNNPDTLLVSVGSEDNMDLDTTSPETGRSMVRAFNLEELGTDGPVEYGVGELFGWGLRNSVGIGENPANGEIWSVDNGLDNMDREGEDIHNDNPGEELNFHGRVNDTNGDYYSANYGYPHCHAVWDTDSVDLEVGSQMLHGEPSDDFDDEYCQSEPVAPRLTFPPHTAPLDVKFAPNGESAYITLHGSWNRSPPDGYRLSLIDFDSDGQPSHPPNSTSAEVRVMQNPDNKRCPGECFRPVGLAWDPERPDRFFMTSDSSGELYVVTVPSGDGYVFMSGPEEG